VHELVPFAVLTIGVFAGAVVSGMAGFAFSAVAGAMLLHVLPPAEAIPLMMICSITVQGVSLVMLRTHLIWRGNLALVAGGLLGIPPALFLLRHIDTGAFRVGFGVFLALYSAFMIFRPSIAGLRTNTGGAQDAAVGFAGGVIGGLTAMPGALPTIWCDLRGMPKDQQRGLVQPFIAAMQVFALVLMLAQQSMPRRVLLDVAVGLPGLAAGTAVGLALFGRMNDITFRRAILTVLFAAGLGLLL